MTTPPLKLVTPWWGRAVAVTIVVGAGMAGLWPCLELWDRTWYTFAALAALAIIAVVYARKAPTYAARPATATEVVTAFGSAVFALATGSLFLVGAQGLIGVVLNGLQDAVNWMGGSWHFDGYRVGWFVAIVASALFIPAFAALSARQTQQILLPAVRDRPRLPWWRALLVPGALLLGLAVSAFILMRHEEAYRIRDALGFVVLILVASQPAQMLVRDILRFRKSAERRRETEAAERAIRTVRKEGHVETVARLFTAAGYEVSDRKAQGEEALVKIDLVAQRGDEAYIIDVDEKNQPGSIEQIGSASALATTARILHKRNQLPESRAVVVSMDVQAHTKPAAYADFTLLNLDPRAVTVALDSTGEDPKAKANELLSFLSFRVD